MTLYVCAGLYAEGNSDDEFLLPLLNRLLDELLRTHYPAQHHLEDSVRLDDVGDKRVGRAHRIANAIAEYSGKCTLYVIHSDGAGDPAAAHAKSIAPGIAAAHLRWNEACIPGILVTVACLPVREIEAWLLVDPEVFRRLGAKNVELPVHPERVTYPKPTLRELLKRTDWRDACPPFDFFGERVSLAALRRLEAFRAFEAELLAALHLLAKPGGR